MSSWDEHTDFLVIGSGAGAMTAALMAHDLGAETLVVEKSDRYGGTSAMSGGTIWIPANRHMQEAGLADSAAEALAYLKSVVQAPIAEARLRAYVEEAPRMVDYLAAHSDVHFAPLLKYPDYYPDEPGAKTGGRAIEPLPFDGLLLGDEFNRMREPHPEMLIMGVLTITAVEAHKVVSGSLRGLLLMLGIILRYLFHIPARLKHKRSTRLALGNGLIGRLRYSLLRRKVPVWLDTAAKELIVEDGHVVGAIFERHGREIRIRARKGVLLAAGGFERNLEMRKQYQRNPASTDWTATHPHNTGDAIRMGFAVGAAVDLMDECWWNTAAVAPGAPLASLLVMEKNLPGSIIVNQVGRRFTNEAAPYTEVVKAMYRAEGGAEPCIPAYLIFDARFRKKYPCGPTLPGRIQPDRRLPDEIRNKFLKKANSLEKLAEILAIPAHELRETVERFNQFARDGKDLEFGRGESIFDRYYGDDAVQPNCTLGELLQPPFYAVEVWPGDVGTKGGLQTDERARVLDGEGHVIPGLFAAGNTSASVMGRVCPGAGATIGPAMVFGSLAAREALAPESKS